MHQILLSGYFREELQQRIWGRCLSREDPIGSCSVIVLLERICSNVGFIYADTPKASNEVGNVADERFHEISGKNCTR